MNDPTRPESNSSRDELIGQWLESRISQHDSDHLQEELRRSPEARERFRELVQLDATMRNVAEAHLSIEPAPQVPVTSTNRWLRYVIAASLLLACGLGSYRVGLNRSPFASTKTAPAGTAPENVDRLAELDNEKELAGYATLRRVAEIEWPKQARGFREGDILPTGMLEFLGGVVEIDFFCGASVVIEGPAKLELESDWAVRLHSGKLRANVPPAARGFTVKAFESEIIDLGTEFALEVGSDAARVQVIDGEIELRGGQHNGERLVTGERQMLQGDQPGESSLMKVSTFADVQRRNELEQRQRIARWRQASLSQRADSRLIAYYPIVEMDSGRDVLNQSVTGHDRDGVLVGSVEQTDGRFGAMSAGLKFDRPGSRVRVRLDGEFEAFTMACWAKIDKLDNRYNALFMADGYENGEPHWQIRNDGRLMFSVMVDDTQDVRVTSIHDAKVVKDAGKHRVYFTDPIWDATKAGQWFHLSAVYDPANRVVRQYVNGDQVASETIEEEFLVKKLRIGPSEIGNWGQPFRPSPWFAVRNLNGVIDELSIYNAALDADEILQMFQFGKPF